MWLWAALIALGSVLASLYPGRVTWIALTAWFAVTVAATFSLPRVRVPHEHF